MEPPTTPYKVEIAKGWRDNVREHVDECDYASDNDTKTEVGGPLPSARGLCEANMAVYCLAYGASVSKEDVEMQCPEIRALRMGRLSWSWYVDAINSALGKENYASRWYIRQALDVLEREKHYLLGRRIVPRRKRGRDVDVINVDE